MKESKIKTKDVLKKIQALTINSFDYYQDKGGETITLELEDNDQAIMVYGNVDNSISDLNKITNKVFEKNIHILDIKNIENENHNMFSLELSSNDKVIVKNPKLDERRDKHFFPIIIFNENDEILYLDPQKDIIKEEDVI